MKMRFYFGDLSRMYGVAVFHQNWACMVAEDDMNVCRRPRERNLLCAAFADWTRNIGSYLQHHQMSPCMCTRSLIDFLSSLSLR